MNVTDGTTVSYVTFNLEVEAVNDEPIFTSSPEYDAKQGETYSYEIEVEDVDGEGVELSVEISENDWISYVTETETITGLPEDEDVGTYSIVIVATVGSDEVSQSYTLEVFDAADYPEASGVEVSATEDIDVKITLIGTDNESEDLERKESPENGDVSISGNIATYSPASNDTGG